MPSEETATYEELVEKIKTAVYGEDVIDGIVRAYNLKKDDLNDQELINDILDKYQEWYVGDGTNDGVVFIIQNKIESAYSNYIGINTIYNDLISSRTERIGKVSSLETRWNALEAKIVGFEFDISGTTASYTRLANTDTDIFNTLEPFQRYRCAVGTGSNSGVIYATYDQDSHCYYTVDDPEHENDFTEDEIIEEYSDCQIMVYQPAYYYKVINLNDNYGTLEPIARQARLWTKGRIFVSDRPSVGFKRHPIFYDLNDNPIDYILFGAYKGSVYDTSTSTFEYSGKTASKQVTNKKLYSRPNKKIAVSYELSQYEQLASATGSGYHIINIQARMANLMLMFVEYGTFDVQYSLGYGPINLPNTSYDGHAPNANYNRTTKTGGTVVFGNISGVNNNPTMTFSYEDTNRAEQVVEYRLTNASDGQQDVTYRGFENPWGNTTEYTGGYVYMGETGKYITYQFNHDYSDNYIDTGITIPMYYIDNCESAAWSTLSADDKVGKYRLNKKISAFGWSSQEFDWLLAPIASDGDTQNGSIINVITAIATKAASFLVYNTAAWYESPLRPQTNTNVYIPRLGGYGYSGIINPSANLVTLGPFWDMYGIQKRYRSTFEGSRLIFIPEGDING